MTNVLRRSNNNWLKLNWSPKIPIANTMKWDPTEKISASFFLFVQVARRIAIMEVDLERAEDRAEAAEA